MRSSLRSDTHAGRLAVLALAVCLIAPPLAHNHGSQPTLITTITGQPCSSSGDNGHLHPATARSAPACPACAAGPSSAAAPAPHDSLHSSASSEPVATLTLAATADAHRSHPRSRAPPCLPAA